MRGKIDEILKQKYDEVEVPSDIFDFDKILKDAKPVRKRSAVLKIAASFIVLVVAISGVAILINSNKNSNQNTVVQADNEEHNIILPTYSKEISINNSAYGFGKYFEKINIYSVEIEKIEQYSTKYNVDDNYSYPITKVKAKVINCYKGENAEEIEFWVPGGVWTVAELKNSNLPYNEIEIGANDSENIKINYYESYYISDVEVGNIYIVCLYKENDQLYVNKNSKYNFKEYNSDTNMVEMDENDWEELDLSDYLN